MIDKSLLSVIIGPLVGLLVMKGLVAPADSNAITNQLDTVIGGAIALVSIIGYIAHRLQKQHLETVYEKAPSAPQTTNTVPVSLG